MKILVLSFYFEPDLCAGSFRATALVNELRGLMSSESHIDVVTTLPNRYSTFTIEAPSLESLHGITINRIALPHHQSGMVDQAKAFLAFSRKALRLVSSQEYDLVFATSSRLMTAVLGAWIAQQKKALLYLDIRDIFVDTIKDVLPKRFVFLAKPIFATLERWVIRRAVKVNLVSQGFAGYFVDRYPNQQFSYFTNGIDDEFIVAGAHIRRVKVQRDLPVTVLYAGNIGEGQGLHAILPELANRMRGRIHFRIIGDGGRKEALRIALQEKNIDNVELLPPVKREELIKAYQEADVLFLHLHDYDAFKKVLPSKLFEYATMGKPILAGVAGYAAEFVHSEIVNAAIFHPCDACEAEQVFASLQLSDAPRDAFVEKYGRTKIMREMGQDILNYEDRVILV